MASKFTVVALHTSHPSDPRADEITIQVADLESILRSNHGGLPRRFESMTLCDVDGVTFRAWFRWCAEPKHYGTDWHILTGSGSIVSTIKMPGFWYSGTAP